LPPGDVIFISGCPGTGKTTISSRLAADASRGVHLSGDVFFSFIVDLAPPHLPESRAQNDSATRAEMATAREFARGGYTVFCDSVVGPRFMPIIRESFEGTGIPLHYLVLRADLETTLERDRRRPGEPIEEVIHKMHAEFSELGAYEKHALETTTQNLDATLAAVRAAVAQGAHLLALDD